MYFMHLFCLCLKICKGWCWNLTWNFGKVMRSKLMMMVSMATIISHWLCMIYAFFLFVFVQKSFLIKKIFLYVEINLTTRGPLYTCLVYNYMQIDILDSGLFDEDHINHPCPSVSLFVGLQISRTLLISFFWNLAWSWGIIIKKIFDLG